MLARVATFAIEGVQPSQVWVEVDIRSGLPAFTVVGLGDTAVRESRDRIRSAILNSASVGSGSGSSVGSSAPQYGCLAGWADGIEWKNEPDRASRQ